MKVILLTDVAKVGRKYDVVEVPNGQALNLLIPQGKAEAATPENVKRVQDRAAKQQAAAIGGEAAFSEAAAMLQAEPLHVTAEANDQGHLFEALKPAAIVAAAAEKGATIVETHIRLDEPIKASGEHDVTLQQGETTATIKIVVN